MHTTGGHVTVSDWSDAVHWRARRLGDQTDGFLEFLQSPLDGIGQFVYVAGDLGGGDKTKSRDPL